VQITRRRSLKTEEARKKTETITFANKIIYLEKKRWKKTKTLKIKSSS